ncbi:putative DND microRNA-mediated repression inhibitor 1, partial [Trypoxylus dichotomus]
MESTEVLVIHQKSKSALVWESFCEAVTSLATSIDCCKTLVRVTHGMVTDSSIILLEVLVPGPRGNIPQDCFEDELLPLFWNIPELYTFRFIFDFRGLCGGFAFAKYKSLESVRKACTLCDGFQIRFNVRLRVTKCRHYCGIYIGEIAKMDVPNFATALDPVLKMLYAQLVDIKSVTIHCSPSLRTANYVIEFYNHHKAVHVRRMLISQMMLLLIG